jgi:SAM-dependent methyltransferase
MHDALYEEMYNMEDSHWWFVARRHIILYLFERYIFYRTGSKARICDMGCGCGATLKAFQAKYDAIGMDSSSKAIEFCSRRGIIVEQGFLPASIPFHDKEFDAILLLDILEHLEKDKESIMTCSKLLRLGGIMLCTVPACPSLWAKRDNFHGHKRRYKKADFAKLFEVPGLRIELLSFFSTFLFPLIAAVRISSRLLEKDKYGTTDITLPPSIFNRCFERVFALERYLVPLGVLPIGSSLVAVCRKISDQTQKIQTGNEA